MCCNLSSQISGSFDFSSKCIVAVNFIKSKNFSPKTFEDVCIGALPLTLEHTDVQGRCIQLWKTFKFGLVGTVLDAQGSLTIIPGEKISNPLNDKQNPHELSVCLERVLRHWDITYDTQRYVLTIWPHLRAAGRPGDNESLESKTLLQKKLHHLQEQQRSAVKTVSMADGRVRYYEREVPSSAPGPTRGRAFVTEHHPQRGTVRSWMECYDHSGKINRVHPKFINGRDVNIQHYPPTGKELAAMSARKQQVNTTPATKNFHTQVQTARLTDSYKATHKQNPIPPKGASGGSIGGVAFAPSYIEGLFDSPAAFFEDEHFFCVPATIDGKQPFSDAELGQILRELAIGIFAHGTVPFFSLHFNENADLYSIIHPVYEHTLVGRVISMLDYFMKGYLNGGVFTESFIDEWHKNPHWKAHSKSALNQMIDFEQYCSGLGVEYESLHALQQKIAIHSGACFEELYDLLAEAKESDQNALRVLRESKGFRNSFRIIAKQNSFQKEGDLFFLDSDFDVLYTIEPSPEYKEALNYYERTRGTLPQSYKSMEMAFEEFCKRIHDDMVKLPLCRDYFAMLGVINFFSCYFSTLKKHQKVPQLATRETLSVKGAPQIFPHLPIAKPSVEILELNPKKFTIEVFATYRALAENYFIQMRKGHLKGSDLDTVNAKKEFHDSILQKAHQILLRTALCPRLVEPAMRDNQEFQDQVRSFADEILQLFDQTALSVMDIPRSTFIERIIQAEKEPINKSFLVSLCKHHREKFEKYLVKLENDFYGLSETLGNERSTFYEAVRSTWEGLSWYFYKNKLVFDLDKLSNEVMDGVEQNFKAMLSRLFELIEERLVNSFKDSSFKLRPIAIVGTRIYSEVKPLDVEKGEKVVGGCGMRLEKQVVKSSAIAKEILLTQAASLYKMDTETWREVSCGASKSRGYVFRLRFQNIPAGALDNFLWMEERFLVPAGADKGVTEERSQIETAIATGNKQEFENLVASSKNLTRMSDRLNHNVMHSAACFNNSFYIQKLAEKGGSLTCEDLHGFQPIHYAAMQGNIDVITYLLRAKGKLILDAKSHNGTTPLITAILHSQADTAKFLLSQGARFSKLSDGYNTLHCALHQGHLPTIEVVLSSPQVAEFINHMSREGGTPLMLACELDSPELIKKMISLGADPKPARWDGVTALEITVTRGIFDCIELLLDKASLTGHAIETIMKEGSVELANLIINKQEVYQYRNTQLETALHIAILQGNQSVAVLLIKNRPDIAFCKAKNKDGETAFSIASLIGAWEVMVVLREKGVVSQEELKKACKRLLYKEYNPILDTFISDCGLSEAEWQDYALEAAKARNSIALITIFKPAGVKFDTLIGPKGWKMEHYLARSDGVALLSHLFTTSDSDILCPLLEEGGKTLPYIAAENGSFRVLRELLNVMKKRGIPLDKHFQGRHLLYAIIELGDIKLFQLVFDTFSDRREELVNVSLDATGIRPVHLIAKFGASKLLKLLISMGADCAALDNEGGSALEYALSFNHNKIAKSLLEREGDKIITVRSIVISSSSGNGPLFQELLAYTKSQSLLDRALFIAIEERNSKAFISLRQSGATYKYVSPHAVTPLLLASRTGQSDILSLMIKDRRMDESFDEINLAIREAFSNGYIHSGYLLLESDLASTSLESSAQQKTLFSNRKTYRKEIDQLQELISWAKNRSDLEQLVAILQTWPPNERIQITYKGEVYCGTPLQLVLFLLRYIDTEGQSILAPLMQNPKLDLHVQDDHGDTLLQLFLRVNILPNTRVLEILSEKVNYDKWGCLHTAALYSTTKILKELLEQLKIYNKLEVLHLKNKMGVTPIFVAVIRGQTEKVSMLVEYGADINAYDAALQTPLGYNLAEKSSTLAMLRLLLQLGADPNRKVTFKKISPIYLAVLNKKDERVRCLLMNGAQAWNAKGKYGATLAHAIAEVNHSSLYKLLSTAECSFEAVDNRGLAPIHVAAEVGGVEVMKVISHSRNDLLHTPLEALQKVVKPKSRGIQGATPLHFAAACGEYAAVDFLLKQKADVSRETIIQKENVVSFAAENAPLNVMQLFSPYKVYNEPETLLKALMHAIYSDNIDVVTDIYSRAVGIGLDIVEGYTGLHLATKYGALQVTQWLLQQGANPLLESDEGKDALMIGAENQSPEQFQLLLEFTEPDLDELRNDKETLIHTAAKVGNCIHILLLLKNFASLNIRDDRGNLPIHVAISNSQYDVVQLLLACGADYTARSARGKSLDDLAEEESEKMKTLLKECFIWLNESVTCKDEPLHTAIRSRNMLAVRVMAYLHDLETQNGDGMTPIQLAEAIGFQDGMHFLQSQLEKIQ